MSVNSFDELKSVAAQGGVEAVLEHLINKLRNEQSIHEMLQVRLMQCRYRLGLPVAQPPVLDKLEEPLRTQVEDAYVNAYREAGQLLLEAGRVREAFMYLRPLGDTAELAEAINHIEPNDENLDEIVEIAIHEGLAPRRGFELVLRDYGICNAITMYESAMYDKPLEQQQQVVQLLVDSLHEELLASLSSEIARQEGSQPKGQSILDLVADREWLFTDDSYHIDTSHLHSVVRFARVADDPAVLAKAIDLCEYGKRLSPQFQYQTEEPFADVYGGQQRFFEALVGHSVEENLAYFREKAETLSPEEHGTGPIEVYVALLSRLGRHDEAMEAAINLLPADARMLGFAPSLVELASRTGNYAGLMQVCEKRNDVLGFAAGLVESQLASTAS